MWIHLVFIVQVLCRLYIQTNPTQWTHKNPDLFLSHENDLDSTTEHTWELFLFHCCQHAFFCVKFSVISVLHRSAAFQGKHISDQIWWWRKKEQFILSSGLRDASMSSVSECLWANSTSFTVEHAWAFSWKQTRGKCQQLLWRLLLY